MTGSRRRSLALFIAGAIVLSIVLLAGWMVAIQLERESRIGDEFEALTAEVDTLFTQEVEGVLADAGAQIGITHASSSSGRTTRTFRWSSTRTVFDASDGNILVSLTLELTWDMPGRPTVSLSYGAGDHDPSIVSRLERKLRENGTKYTIVVPFKR